MLGHCKRMSRTTGLLASMAQCKGDFSEYGSKTWRSWDRVSRAETRRSVRPRRARAQMGRLAE